MTITPTAELSNAVAAAMKPGEIEDTCPCVFAVLRTRQFIEAGTGPEFEPFLVASSPRCPVH